MPQPFNENDFKRLLGLECQTFCKDLKDKYKLQAISLTLIDDSGNTAYLQLNSNIIPTKTEETCEHSTVKNSINSELNTK